MPPRRAAHMKMLWLKRESISHSKNLLLGFEQASNNKRHKPRFALHWSLIFFDATRARGENENELTRRKRMGLVSALSPEEMRTQIYEVIFEKRAEQLLQSGLFMVASLRHFPDYNSRPRRNKKSVAYLAVTRLHRNWFR